MTTTPQEALRKALNTLKRIVAGDDDAWKCADNIIADAEEAITALSQQAAQEPQPVKEMRLCESSMLALRPDQLYLFTVDPTCPQCVEAASLYAAAPANVGHCITCMAACTHAAGAGPHVVADHSEQPLDMVAKPAEQEKAHHPACDRKYPTLCDACIAEAEQQAPSTAAQEGVDRYFPFEFEVWQGEEMCASASGPRESAHAEAMNYAAQYAQDGTVRVFEVKRELVAAIAHNKGAQEGEKS